MSRSFLMIILISILIGCNQEKKTISSSTNDFEQIEGHESSLGSTLEDNFDDLKEKDESCDTEKEFVPPSPTKRPAKLQGHNDGGCKIE